jgi:NAD(P)-dependent dehydrogenase (short-subunit alcohol dehydrogenase family)
MSKSLTAEIAVVTGGGRDLGREIALSLATQGADVAIIGRTQQTLNQTAKAIEALDRRALPIVADVTREGEIVEAFELIVARLGPPTILVANASAARKPCAVADMTLGEWNLALATKLTSAMLCARQALATMVPRKKGNIIFVSGTTGLRAAPFMSAHSVAQAGLIALAQALALEVGRYHIRVNSVVPSAIEGESLRKIVSHAEAMELDQSDPIAQLTTLSPLGRLVQPREVASTVCFLASEAASGITGQAVNILLDQMRPT